jgi:hypothetical protein
MSPLIFFEPTPSRSVRVTVDDLPAPMLASRTAVAPRATRPSMSSVLRLALNLPDSRSRRADVVDLVALGLGGVVEHGAE